MSSPRIVSVFGATGLQGSSVVAALLKDTTFTPRAITRDATSDAAMKLKARGVEIVQADLYDKASLVSALRGSEAVFGVSVPAEVTSAPAAATEYEQGKNMVDAAKEADVKFFVFSSLPSLAKMSGGKLLGIHLFEGKLPIDLRHNMHSQGPADKARIQKYLESSDIPNVTLLLGGFLENLWKVLTRNSSHNFGALKKTPTGKFEIAIPNYRATAKASLTWVGRNVGQSVLVLLKSYTDPSKSVVGKVYPILSTMDSYPALATLISKVLGVEVTFTGAPSGTAIVDDMYAVISANNGLYPDAPALNPDLVALGVKFGTIEEFLEEEIKPRYA
ncbi:hypothetical protein C8R44DRAFT_633074 [Mycena epipterygia]|nr:hypothetical protein C8R44DRAFT_633074 [Mycena epipterygia]